MEGWEGCLSIPDIRGMVPRCTDITVRALDRNGKAIELPLKDFAARVAQHETDHLDGVLFFDRMTSMQSLTYLDEYSRYHAKDDGLDASRSCSHRRPSVTLRTAPMTPFDGAIAAARTCYSPRVIGTAEVTDSQRDTIGALTFDAGHHTVYQHAHFEFGLENISRQFVWAFLHSYPVLQLRAVEPALRQAEGAARVRAADRRRGARRLRAAPCCAPGTATPSCRRCSRTTRSAS